MPVKPAQPPAPAINELHETIKLQIDATNKQSLVMLKLTRVMVFIGCVQILVAIVQVVMAFK